MSLDAAARRRYARQLLLGEIDEDAQVRLLDSRFRRAEVVDADAFAVAVDYLERAGCTVADDGIALGLPDAAAVDALAGRPSLRAPAAALVGAFVAVEHIKQALDSRDPLPFPPDLRLSTDE